MPKIIDHEARRAELSRVVWKVIEEHGVEGTTIQRICEESGWSNGVLAHYFSSKDDLLAFAFDLSFKRTAERLARRMTEIEPDREALGALILEMLPLDPERRTESLVWAGAMTRAFTDERLRGIYSEHYEAWREATEEFVRALMAAGALGQASDPTAIATQLMAFTDGLTLLMLLHPDQVTEKSARASTDDFVARMGSAP